MRTEQGWMTIKPALSWQLRQAQYLRGYEQVQLIEVNGKPAAYAAFELAENGRMQLHMIEVIEKEQGMGRHVLSFLFEQYALEQIEGMCLREKRAYGFWQSVGADIALLAAGETTLSGLLEANRSSPFVLTKHAFARNQASAARQRKKAGVVPLKAVRQPAKPPNPIQKG